MFIPYRLSAAALLVCGMVLGAHCAKTAEPLPAPCEGIDPLQNTYTLRLKAVLDANCAIPDCHAANAPTGGMADYAGARRYFEQLDALCSIRQDAGCPPMPKGGIPLPAEVVRHFECWVENGFRE